VRLDGYVCETCLAYQGKRYTLEGPLPEDWVELKRYTGPGTHRNLHWCSQRCFKAMIQILPRKELQAKFAEQLDDAFVEFMDERGAT
jgi:hypothetical protein